MHNCFFSIILPTYNRGHMVTTAIESVLAQTYANWEMLVVDDGSTDNTRQIVTAYQDNRIKYIYQDNAERSAARNNGIKCARGTYITFLDSDDYFLPERLQQLHQAIAAQNFPEALFYSGLLLQNDQGVQQPVERYNAQLSAFDNIATATIHSQQVVAHRAVFADNLYNPQLTVAEDMELWLRIAGHFAINFLPGLCSVVVLQHEDRSVNLKKYNSAAKQYFTYSHIFGKGHAGNKITPAIVSGMYSACFFGMAKYAIYQRNNLKAACLLIRSVIASPRHPQTMYKLNILRWLLLFNPGKAEQLLN